MKNIGILAIATVAALVLGFGASLGNSGSTPTAHAAVTDTVAIPCEFLASAIDGNLDNATDPVVDGGNACNGISAAEVANLANVLGDADDTLEASDFTDIDLDANQVSDGGAVPKNATLIFAFVDNDGTVTFDAQVGLTTTVYTDAGAASADADTNPETCAGVDDLDCSTTTLSDGDGVVVASVADNASGAAGDAVDVDTFQADDTGSVSTQTINIVGKPDDVTLSVLKNPIGTSGTTAAEVNTCVDDSDVSDAAQLGDLNRTFLKAEVVDADGTPVTRAKVTFAVDSAASTIAAIDDDVNGGEVASDPKAFTGESVDAGAAGVASFAVVCGGRATGTATITATEAVSTRKDTADVDVVGAPANVAVTVSPAAIDCNGTATSTVSATVTDSGGNNVADGTNVNFSVVALGTANPINAKTTAGVATSTVTPLSGAVAGVTVIAKAGDVETSIRIDCNTPAAATPVGPAATPTRAGGTIGGPDTGNGGYAGQDSAGFPLWTLVALALGSMALIGGAAVTRRAGK